MKESSLSERSQRVPYEQLVLTSLETQAMDPLQSAAMCPCLAQATWPGADFLHRLHESMLLTASLGWGEFERRGFETHPVVALRLLREELVEEEETAQAGPSSGGFWLGSAQPISASDEALQLPMTGTRGLAGDCARLSLPKCGPFRRGLRSQIYSSRVARLCTGNSEGREQRQ